MRRSRFSKEKTVTSGESTASAVMEAKLAAINKADFYGAHQLADEVMFVAFYPQASTVQVAGDFNNWQPEKTPMQKTGDGAWQVKLPLAKGVYRYRLVVDGHWQQDPYNKMTEPNPYGGLNSVLKVT